MTDKKSNHLNHQDDPENEMVTDFDDVVELGKEMEQISDANDEDKGHASHDRTSE